MARFFFGAAAGGQLRLRDIPDGSDWNTERIVFWDELYIDGISRLALAGQKVRSASELDDMLVASRTLPATRWLWIHEDLLDEARRRWSAPRVAKSRRRVWGPAMIGAGFAVALAAGLIAFAGVPQQTGPLPSPDGGTVRVPRAHGVRAASHGPAYAVRVGTFASAGRAERLKHLVAGKGYIVIVWPRGVLSEVTTRPYRTREQAERVARGLTAAGVPAHLMAWHLGTRGDRIAPY